MRVGRFFLALRSFSRGADHGIRLMSEIRSEFAMGGHYLAGRMNLLPIAGGVRGDLGRLLSIATSPFQILANLLAPRA
jgi:hypothetical protein